MSRAPDQLHLFDPPQALPEGLDYRPDFITPREEAALVSRLADLPFAPFQFRGFEGKRRTVSFGLRYDFNGQGLGAAEPLPTWLLPLRDRVAVFADAPPVEVAHVLINEYLPGAPIGWHRDRPVFDRVIGVSLLSPARLRFRRRQGERWARAELACASRSAYILNGPARHLWEHSIPPASAHRYSITFRTLAAS